MSFKTVSRVINGEPGVSPALTQKVEAAVLSLGYRPDHRASQLRRGNPGRSSTIGVVTVDVANQFFGSLMRGIESVATDEGCVVLSGSTDRSTERERQLIDSFVERRVDGLIIVYSGSSMTDLLAERARGTPIVFLDLEPDVAGIDLVRADHYGGAVAATTHLIAHGHTEIAFFGDTETVFSATLRRKGFIDSMTKAGLTVPDHRVITKAQSVEAWETLTTEHLKDPGTTAIFSAQNMISLGVLRAIHQLGLQHEIAQVGFDDLDLATLVQPALSVVVQNPLEMGRTAAELLNRRIRGDEFPPVRDIRPTPLVARGSGELRA